jgi:hypothetical protein
VDTPIIIVEDDLAKGKGKWSGKEVKAMERERDK